MIGIDTIFADGGVIGRNPSSDGGTWAYLSLARGEVLFEESGVVVPEEVGLDRITNNLTELLACVLALESMPDGWSGRLYTDSNVTRCRLVNADPGFVGIPDCLRERVRVVRSRLGSFSVTLLDGHPTRAQLESGVGKRGNPCSRHNVRCDALCGERSREFSLARREPPADAPSPAVAEAAVPIAAASPVAAAAVRWRDITLWYAEARLVPDDSPDALWAKRFVAATDRLYRGLVDSEPGPKGVANPTPRE